MRRKTLQIYVLIKLTIIQKEIKYIFFNLAIKKHQQIYHVLWNHTKTHLICMRAVIAAIILISAIWWKLVVYHFNDLNEKFKNGVNQNCAKALSVWGKHSGLQWIGWLTKTIEHVTLRRKYVSKFLSISKPEAILASQTNKKSVENSKNFEPQLYLDHQTV